jgi:hypothetical protein
MQPCMNVFEAGFLRTSLVPDRPVKSCYNTANEALSLCCCAVCLVSVSSCYSLNRFAVVIVWAWSREVTRYGLHIMPCATQPLESHPGFDILGCSQLVYKHMFTQLILVTYGHTHYCLVREHTNTVLCYSPYV